HTRCLSDWSSDVCSSDLAFENWLSPGDFLAWGWRVPFLLSGLLVVVGLLVRVRILETPLFRQLQQAQQVAQAPIRETLRRHWRRSEERRVGKECRAGWGR